MPKLFLKSSIPCLLIGLPGNVKLILVTILLGKFTTLLIPLPMNIVLNNKIIILFT